MIFKGYGGLSRLLKGGVLSIFLALPARAEPVTILALGDSLTAGYGLPQGEGLVPQLEAWMRERGADVSIINAGVSGDTTAGGASRLGWVLTPDVDVVMVALGGNDMLRGLPPEETHRNLDQILTELSARDLPVLLVGIAGPSNFGNNYKMKFDAIFPTLASQHATALYPNILHALTEGEDASSTREKFLQSDGLHPNREGVLRIVNSLGTKLLMLVSNAKS